ncbi:nif-specific transcriptional activator NifA [Telmatospirillum sp. J64-1]|uniref:nif-specific transcriptional activator NifA n=1 Tax=Telmatospirillum sp. J64-1 TaxID=2502183 RepID=UPI00115E76F7|nr:nif-specific transcriptional activator NifA [Telmatospirillum sp. J64-1]
MLAENRNSTALSLISIYEISKILSSSLHLEKTLRDVLNVLSSYLQMRHGMISLVGDGGALDVVAASGLSPAAIRKMGGSLEKSAAGQVLSSGMPIVIPDLRDEPGLQYEGWLDDTLDGEAISFIGVPIKTTDKPFGVLSIDRVFDAARKDVSYEADVRFLSMVANLIGQTVRMHQHVASERERLIEEQHRLQKALVVQREQAQQRVGLDNIIGVSRRMQDVYAEIHQIAPSRSTVLLRGESGTGKELIARAIHCLSTRKDGPFIKLNCAALPETLLESELFGHEKGAFTGATAERKGRFELANHGTLFLDEIGEISPSFQAKLLRVLQESEFERVGGNKTIRTDVRLIAATNRNLEAMVANGEFRADLYYRINVVPVFLPPLRERKEDIPMLVEHFIRRFNQENARHVNVSEEAMQVLLNCYFPGNVRELENCVNRVATMSRGDVVRDVDLPCQRNLCLSAQLWKHSSNTFRQPEPALANIDERDEDAGDDLFFEEGQGLTQRDRLLRAMEKAGWVQAKAARLLGLTPRQIGYALKKYNIEVKRL